jgi:hypothetical protein
VEASLIGPPTQHIRAEGTSMFGMGARVPAQVISSLVPASRQPVVACSGSVPAATRSTGLLSHY